MKFNNLISIFMIESRGRSNEDYMAPPNGASYWREVRSTILHRAKTVVTIIANRRSRLQSQLQSLLHSLGGVIQR